MQVGQHVELFMRGYIVQDANALSKIFVTLPGNVMLVKLVQPANADPLILVTPLNKMAFVSMVQFSNASP
jgi:hypothetical protein